MKSQKVFVACLFLALLITASWANFLQGSFPPRQSASTPLTNDDIIEMLKLGLSPEIVAAKVKNVDCNFDTSIAGLKALKTAGVPDAVLLAMVQTPAIRKESENRPCPESEVLSSFFQFLPWPVLALVALIVWGRHVSRLLRAFIERVESGARIEAGGVVIAEPPDEAYEPYETVI